MAENAVKQFLVASNALISILRSGRADFNARFAAARRVHPELEPNAFAQFLGSAVDALAVAVEKARPDRVAEVTMAAYDAALELVGQRLAGPGSRAQVVEEAWTRILPKAAALVASAPGRIIPAVCNAAHQLATTPGTRPDQWISAMENLAPQCADADAFLKLGVLCAWRSGLAHYRSTALSAADGLPETLVLEALGAKAGMQWPAVREHLTANPWYDPAMEQDDSQALRAVGQAGAFKGYGGLFIEPPLVVLSGGQFLARSGDECWWMTADVFGTTFQRASQREYEAAKRNSRLPSDLEVTGSHLVYRGGRFEFPELGKFTSAAASATTLALTSELTHAITLVALS